MKTNIDINNKEGIGLYLNNSKVKYSGVLNLNGKNDPGKNGLGIYVTAKSVLRF